MKVVPSSNKMFNNLVSDPSVRDRVLSMIKDQFPMFTWGTNQDGKILARLGGEVVGALLVMSRVNGNLVLAVPLGGSAYKKDDVGYTEDLADLTEAVQMTLWQGLTKIQSNKAMPARELRMMEETLYQALVN